MRIVQVFKVDGKDSVGANRLNMLERLNREAKKSLFERERLKDKYIKAMSEFESEECGVKEEDFHLTVVYDEYDFGREAWTAYHYESRKYGIRRPKSGSYRGYPPSWDLEEDSADEFVNVKGEMIPKSNPYLRWITGAKEELQEEEEVVF